jgi:hypothetical protein
VPASAQPEAPLTPSDSFEIDWAEARREGVPDSLLRRLAQRPYNYFRFLSQPFSERVCRHFADVRWHLPVGILHGDAHVGQYVITESTHGIEDFDRASFGPSVIDLVRFSTSLELACRETDFPCNGPKLVRAFLDNYRLGLTDGDTTGPPPSVVTRLRSAPARSAQDFLTWADGLMRPLNATQTATLESRWLGFLAHMRALEPGRPASFYALKHFGALQMGIGSALDEKYLFRIEGPSPMPEDDLIVEAKEQKPLQPISCMVSLPSGGVMRPLIAAVTLGRRTPEILTRVPLPETGGHPHHFWVQSWDRGYQELSLGLLTSETDLLEVAIDVGRQLGSANPRLVPPQVRRQQEFAELSALDLVQSRVEHLATVLAEETIRAYAKFQKRVPARPSW